MQIHPSSEASDLVRELEARLAKHAGEPLSDAFLARDHSELWAGLESDGWMTLGRADEATGYEPSVRDLAEFARTWGRHLVPLPFTLTMLSHRWAAPGSPPSGYAVVPLPLANGQTSFIPWAGSHGLVALGSSGSWEACDFSPSRSAGAPTLPGMVVHAPAPQYENARARELYVCIAAEAVGAAETTLDLAAAYAKQRTQFGKPIASFQATKHRLAEMLRDSELARAGLAWASNGEDWLIACKRAVGLARNVAEQAVQVHGAIAFTWELGLHFYLRHILACADLLLARAPSMGVRKSLVQARIDARA